MNMWAFGPSWLITYGHFSWAVIIYTLNPFYIDTPYNIKIRYNEVECHETFSQEVRVKEKLCKNIALKLQATYVLDIC